ncbi:hypothetical protein [Komagataeibacter oboediens]|uniref:hypothetical protein n=1 Tax=Komagataeibacter oboediens TaxID=65958 RepID=UPI0019065750|nr:hypothetical protein [Komagataeibacter oboediens]
MSSEGIFVKIDDEADFISSLSSSLKEMPDFISYAWKVKITLSEEEIKNSFSTYKENLKYFSRHLASKSPDEFKRAAALLLALCDHNVITNVIGNNCEMGKLYSDGVSVNDYINIAKSYPKEIVIFHICYQYCSTYCSDYTYRRLSSEYLENMCQIINKHIRIGPNEVFSLDSLFIVFRSLFETKK